MKFEGFIGGSYESRAFTADQEHTINWFVEDIKSPGATSKRALMPTPGVEVITSSAIDSPGRAHYAINGREFAVIGAYFLELGRDGTILTSQTAYGAYFLTGLSTLLNGLIPNTSQPATISCNGDGGGELFITAGGNGYIFDLTTKVLTKIMALEGIAQFGGHLDGYFVALDTVNSKLYVSGLYDGLTWDVGGTFAQRSLGPDKWLSMEIVGRAVWLYGELTSEVWYNTGDRFPLSPLANQVINYGITAPWSAATLGNDILWLSNSMDGKVCVMRASGMSPEVVSTPALEAAMQSYLSRTSAVADAYTDEGHSFYMLSFDADKVTWCLDLATGLWHQRGTWAPESNEYVAWRPRFHTYAFGEHRMLDASNANVYRLSAELQRDVDGRLIRRLRKAPAISNENKRVFYSELELDLEPGIGEDRGQVSFAMQPQIATFSGTITLTADGPIGGAVVIIDVDGNTAGTDTTDANGKYEILDVPNGTTITITATADDPANPGCQVCAQVVRTYDPFLTGPGDHPELVYNLTLVSCGCGPSFSWTKGGETSIVYFTDTTVGVVSSWAWTFVGGTPDASTDQNPNTSYDLTGDPDQDHVFTATMEIDGGPNTASATLVINFNASASGVGLPI